MESQVVNNYKNKRNYTVSFIGVFILILFYIFQMIVGIIFFNDPCQSELRSNYSTLNVGFGATGTVLLCFVLLEIYFAYKDKYIGKNGMRQMKRWIFIGMLLFIMSIISLFVDFIAYKDNSASTCYTIMTVLPLIRCIIEIIYIAVLIIGMLYGCYTDDD